MSVVDKTKPDVLRVTEYIIEQAKINTGFSVASAARGKALNGINEFRIAEIIRDICLEPNGPNSLNEYTTIDMANSHSSEAKWQLNANAYFSYLSLLAIKESEKANQLATKTLKVAIAAAVFSFLSIFIAA